MADTLAALLSDLKALTAKLEGYIQGSAAPDPTPRPEPTPQPEPTPAPPHAVGVEISGPKQLTVGEIGHYHAQFLMSDGSKEAPKGVRWVPHNRRVLDFPADGNNWSGQYQGKAPGQAKVIYSGGGQRGAYPVTVLAADESDTSGDTGETPAPSGPPSGVGPEHGGPVTGPDPGHVSGGTTPGSVHARVTVDNGDGSTTVLEEDFSPQRSRFALPDGSRHWLALRHYEDGAVRVENGYIGTPGEFHADIALNGPDGRALMNETHVRLSPYCSHRAVWYKQPRAKALDYAKLPNYAAGTPVAQHAADHGANTINPIYPIMPATGERIDLGLQPGYYVPAIVDPTDANNAVVKHTADALGSLQFCVIDPATDAPPVIAPGGKWARASLNQPGKYRNPIPAHGYGSSPVRMDWAHMPELTILPALLFDTDYHREQLHLAANHTALFLNFNYRDRGRVRIDTGQTRMQAWMLRTVAGAAAILDSEYFRGWLDNTADHLEHVHRDYKIKGIPILRTHPKLDGGKGLAPWEQDYWMSAVAYAARLGFERYKTAGLHFGQLSVQRMLDMPHELATVYMLNPWVNKGKPGDDLVADWAAAVRQSYTKICQMREDSIDLARALEPKHIGQYNAGDFDGYPWSSTGYAAIMQPALAGALDVGVPRAQEAWDKYTRYARWNPDKDWKYNIIPAGA